PLEIDASSNITIANLHMYRVVSSYQPFPYAIKVTNSKDIRLRNIHCYGDNKVSFDNAVYDSTHNVEVRQREFAWLNISGNTPQALPNRPSTVLTDGAKLEKLAGGFFNISGGAVDQSGNFYFVDPRWQTIYRWSAAKHELSKIRDNPVDPVQLLFDNTGNLIVISYAGKGAVYSFKPDSPNDDIILLKPEPSAPRPQMTPVLPVDYWRNQNDFTNFVTTRKPYHFLSPDGTVFIPAGEDFVSGELYYGSKMHDVLRAFGMARAVPARRFYVSDEEEEKTNSASVGTDGTL